MLLNPQPVSAAESTTLTEIARAIKYCRDALT
jgi:hypothetical protein